jgi:hypothetical protein
MQKQRCAHFGCNQIGTHLLCVNVPTDDLASTEPATVVVDDLMFCERHLAVLDAADTIKRNPSMRAWFERMPGADIGGAYLSGLPVGSPGHLEALMQHRERAEACQH